MGLSLLVEPAYRLPNLNAVLVPAGIDEAKVRGRLLQRYGIELGAGLGALGGKIWRIGLMGQSCSAANVVACLTALEVTLSEMGAPVTLGEAVPAATAILFPS